MHLMIPQILLPSLILDKVKSRMKNRKAHGTRQFSKLAVREQINLIPVIIAWCDHCLRPAKWQPHY